MSDPKVAASSLIGKFNYVVKLTVERNTASQNVEVRLARTPSLQRPVAVVSFFGAEEVKIGELSFGLFLEIRDIRYRQLDRLRYEAVDIEQTQVLSLKCRDFDFSIEGSADDSREETP